MPTVSTVCLCLCVQVAWLFFSWSFLTASLSLSLSVCLSLFTSLSFSLPFHLQNSPPYVMWKEGAAEKNNVKHLQGYCIDLLKEIASILGFKFQLIPVDGDLYGSVNERGQWNGLIGQVISHQADLAIADLTITRERQSVVDFTVPFMSSGISIIYRKDKNTSPIAWHNIFTSLLEPFAIDLWLYTVAAIIATTVLLYVVSRLSPYEWVTGHRSPHSVHFYQQNQPQAAHQQQPHQHHRHQQQQQQQQLQENNVASLHDHSYELENQFCFSNCLWFAFASLMHQRTNISPRALSTRTLTSIWSFFTLIIISSYTANLTAFLTGTLFITPLTVSLLLVQLFSLNPFFVTLALSLPLSSSFLSSFFLHLTLCPRLTTSQ